MDNRFAGTSSPGLLGPAYSSPSEQNTIRKGVQVSDQITPVEGRITAIGYLILASGSVLVPGIGVFSTLSCEQVALRYFCAASCFATTVAWYFHAVASTPAYIRITSESIEYRRVVSLSAERIMTSSEAKLSEIAVSLDGQIRKPINGIPSFGIRIWPAKKWYIHVHRGWVTNYSDLTVAATQFFAPNNRPPKASGNRSSADAS